MWTRDALQSNAALPPVAGAGVPAPAVPAGAAPNQAFSKALRQAANGAQTSTLATSLLAGRSATGAMFHTITDGQTLIGVVRQQAQLQGLKLSSTQELQFAQQLASANRVGNADLVYPGQTISLASIQDDFQGLKLASAARQANTMRFNPGLAASAVARPSTPMAYDVRSPRFTPAASAVARSNVRPLPATGAHPVLEKTLDRAVAKGFIPAAEKAAVYDKILQMADNHRFSPDDFARMTLMESDGMNPRASNQRCHGIIQFCDGPARGAASAGYAANPKAILELSVHKQLSLVDKYFDDVGLKSQGPAGLEDLYLSVLNPASRAEAQSDAPLNIQGQQARALHVDKDSEAPITRQSIRAGLLENAAVRLGQMLPASVRLQAQRAQQYVENKLP